MIQSVSNFTTKKSKNYSLDDNRKQKIKINQSSDMFLNVGSKQKVSAKQVSFRGVANYGTQEDREILKSSINPLVIKRDPRLTVSWSSGYDIPIVPYDQEVKQVGLAMKAAGNILKDFSNDAQYRFQEIRGRNIKLFNRLGQAVSGFGLPCLSEGREKFLDKIYDDVSEIVKDKREVDGIYWDGGIRRIFKSHSVNTVTILNALTSDENRTNLIGTSFNEMSRGYDNLNEISQNISIDAKNTGLKIYNRQVYKQAAKDLLLLGKIVAIAFGVAGAEDAVANGGLDFLDNPTVHSVTNALKASNVDQFANYGLDGLRDVAKEFKPEDIIKISKYAKML